MTTATAPAPVAAPERTDADRAPSSLTLVKVELRKMVDTRSGFWLVLSLAAFTVLVVVVLLLVNDDGDRSVRDVLEGSIQPAGILLPVVGILLVTSEWSQRTHLTTFALVPNRMRVISAKAGAAVVLAFVALLFAVAVTTIGVLIAGGDAGGPPASILGQDFLFVVAGMLTGLAFGALLLSSAPAIVLFFVLPTVFAALGSIAAFEDAAAWLDTSRTLTPLVERNLDGEEWAQAGTSLLLWLVLPLLVGLYRIRRGEIS